MLAACLGSLSQDAILRLFGAEWEKPGVLSAEVRRDRNDRSK